MDKILSGVLQSAELPDETKLKVLRRVESSGDNQHSDTEVFQVLHASLHGMVDSHASSSVTQAVANVFTTWSRKQQDLAASVLCKFLCSAIDDNFATISLHRICFSLHYLLESNCFSSIQLNDILTSIGGFGAEKMAESSTSMEDLASATNLIVKWPQVCSDRSALCTIIVSKLASLEWQNENIGEYIHQCTSVSKALRCSWQQCENSKLAIIRSLHDIFQYMSKEKTEYVAIGLNTALQSVPQVCLLQVRSVVSYS